MRKSLNETMKSKGMNILGEDAVERFMERHRVRYAGGITGDLGKAFREETGTGAVLLLSFDLYDETDPPKIALTARLVSTGEGTGILWMDGVAMAGNDSPGILGLGRIRNPGTLWKKARERLVDSLAGFLAGKHLPDGRGGGSKTSGIRVVPGGKYRPKTYHKGTPERATGKETCRIAVLPFYNESTRRNAGEIMALHLIHRLSEPGNFDVIEPGEVRKALLMSRTIMESGLSLAQGEVLRTLLDADLVLTGDVVSYSDYSGPYGNPEVNFSMRVFDMRSKRVTWTSISHNRGDDGVFFFDMGKVNTAHALASTMARAAAGMMSR
jgi:hypothetical protein